MAVLAQDEFGAARNMTWSRTRGRKSQRVVSTGRGPYLIHVTRRQSLPSAYWIFRNTSGAVDGWRNTFTDGVHTYRLADWDPNTGGGDFAVIDIEKGGFVTHDWTEGIPYAWLAANGFVEGGRVRFKFAFIPSGGYGNASIWTYNDCNCGTLQAAALVDPRAQALWARQSGGCMGCGDTPP